MPILALRLGDVTIQVDLKSREVEAADQPYLDWLRCQVHVIHGGFTGDVAWNVMPGELRGLAGDLLRIYEAFPSRAAVEFEPTEPNLVLTFAVGSRGHVEGTYEVRDTFVDATSMRGSFVIEQAALRGLAGDIREFVAAATTGAA